MGVVNATPDSFSDGGLYFAADAAIAHARDLIAEGADIVDVGGESTRPGASPVAVDEELRRVLPVVEGVAPTGVPISIDTSKASVARACLDAGATIVNDVSALRADPDMAGVIADSGCTCVLMHMLGSPRTMQRAGGPKYNDVVDDVRAFLTRRLELAVGEGIRAERIVLDPGIGFGKTLSHNLTLLRRLPELVALGRPVLVGTSRKHFLGRLIADAGSGVEPALRLPGTIATNVLAFERGAAWFRVHDVAPVRAALAVAAATLDPR